MSSKVIKAVKNAKGTIKTALLSDPSIINANMNTPGTSTGLKRRPGRPKKTKRTFGNKKPKSLNSDGEILKNKFDTLSSLDDMSEGENSDHSQDQEIQKKPQQMPPIVVTSNINNVKQFYEDIKQQSKAETIHFKSYKDTKQIITYNKNDYSEIQKYLESKEIQFYAYTLKEDKPKKLCLKGIDKSYDVTDIYNDILKLTSEVIKVVQLKSLKDKKEMLNVYLVYFKSVCDINVIVKTIRYLCDHKIKWEPYHKSRKNMVTQCSKCQRFGHASNNCNHPYRCIKCTEVHEVNQCKITKEDKPKCVNCSLEHPANYRNCKAYKEYIAAKKKQFRRPQTDKYTPNFINYQNNNNKNHNNNNSSVLYSTVLSGQNNSVSNSQFSTNNTQTSNFNASQRSQINTQNINQQIPVSTQHAVTSNPSNFNFIMNEINQLFGMTILQLNNKIQSFMPKYLSETNIQEKKILLLSFLIEAQVFN